MARTGTSVYPATLDAFDRIGTANYEDESGYDHVNVHNEVMDGIEHIQAAIGTTAGTNVLKNAVAGQFVSFTAGTETLTNKTINNAVIGTSVITGGTANSITLGTPIITGAWDGWIASGETWTSLSGTAITPGVTTTSKYQKGDKIKFTQGGTTMYQYITSVSGTQFVSTGGADYVLGTTAITSPFYSKFENPQSFPSSFSFTATQYGFSVNQGLYSNFQINGRLAVVCYVRNVTDGTSNADNLALSLPITSQNALGRAWFGFCSSVDGGSVSTMASFWTVSAGEGSVTFFKTPYNVAWATAGAKSILGAIVQYYI